MRAAVLGGGSWGTAIARLLGQNLNRVNFYIRDKSQVENISKYRENKKYLPGAKLSDNIYITSDLDMALSDVEIIVVAVPTSAIRELLTSIKEKIKKDTYIVNLSKGIEEGSLMRISEICEEILPENPFIFLSGPSHAEEVGKDIPTTVVAASKDIEDAMFIQEVFSNKYLRVYTNTDLLGVEIGAALKNIIALAAGISDGLGYGDNTKAALMTRGIYEMNKLAIKMGADAHTLNGLSGIGDLIVTCTSMHSRNRRAGILIGKGKNTEQACREVGQVVEGVKTSKAAYELCKKLNVEMPLTKALYEILYEGKDAKQTVDKLMKRRKKREIEEDFLAAIVGEDIEKE